MTESTTGLEIGVWFNDERCWMYRGNCSAVIQFYPKDGGYIGEPMIVSRCPQCEAGRLRTQFPGQKVKRWLLLPL